MTWKADEVRNWKDLRDWVDAITCDGKSHMFRGQPGPYGVLKPKFLRLLENGGITDHKRAHEIESDLLERFIREAPVQIDEPPVRALLNIPGRAAILTWWGIMQHYGAPTRVLDWTGSPYVATYFAVEKELESDGEIWCYREEQLEAKWRLAIEQKKLNSWPVGMAYQDYEQMRKIDDKPILHHFIHGTRTIRMAAQQGVFTVCTDVFQDHAKLLAELLGPDQEKRAYRRTVISKRLKPEFLEHLRFMNITGASLFPGIDGVGRFIDESARIHLYRRVASEMQEVD
jgi:hypothetical protein